MRTNHPRPWYPIRPITAGALVLAFVVTTASAPAPVTAAPVTAVPTAGVSPGTAALSASAAVRDGRRPPRHDRRGWVVRPMAQARPVRSTSEPAGPIWASVPGRPFVVPAFTRRPTKVCASSSPVEVKAHSQELWAPGKASAYLVGCMVIVARGGRLTLAPGTVVKFGYNGGGGPIYVAPGGSLVVEGTATHPVFFTSVEDNSVGGHTAAPGGPALGGNYGDAIAMDGRASVLVSHAVFRNGNAAIDARDPLLIAGCAVYGGDVLVVKGSLLSSPISMGPCDSARGAHYWFSGDTFDFTAGNPSSPLAISGYPADVLRVEANSFDSMGPGAGRAMYINGPPVEGISLAGPTTNSFSSRDGHLVVDLVNATVAPGASWAFASPDGAELEGQVTVDGRAVLAPGAVLADQAQLTVGPDGSLNAEGTARSPVHFNDGSGISTAGSGTLAVDHAVFSGDSTYAINESGCDGHGHESVDIENSSFASEVNLGACNSHGDDRFTITGNTFEVPSGSTALNLTIPDLSKPAYPGRLVVAANLFTPSPYAGTHASTSPSAPEVSVFGWPVQGVALSGPRTNRLVGSGAGRVVDIIFCQVPAGASWTVSPSSGAVFEAQGYYLGSSPGVAVDGRLVLAEGTTVKVASGFSFGIGLGSGGTLDAIGTAARPIIFTSMDDDSVGGDSTGAKTVAGQTGYSVAVQADEGSRVDVSHAVFRNGAYAFDISCSAVPQDNGRFILTNSVVQDEVALGDCDATDHSYVPELQNDTFDFDGAATGQFAAGGGYDPSALQPALFLYNLDPSEVALSGLGSNLFIGKGAGRVIAMAGTTVPEGESWTVSGTSGAVLAPWPDTDYLDRPGITVDGSMNLGPGSVVKSDLAGIGIDVDASGVLAVDGSAQQPVAFSAISDDKVAGDSNGDVSASAPKPGAYGVAIQFEHINLGQDMPISHAVFEYATDALSYEFMGHSVTVSNSDFTNDVAAIEVEETSGPDYDAIGDIPCVPPWLTGVNADDDWFGPTGPPAPDIDLASFIGAEIPGSIPFSGTAFNLSGVGNLIDVENPLYGGPNTVPWAIYSCAAIKVPFPLTAVAVNGTPGAPNFASFDKPALVAAPTRPLTAEPRREAWGSYLSWNGKQ